MNSNRLGFLLVSCVVLYGFSNVVLLTILSPYPDGRDVWFHILVARAWWKGQNGMVAPVVLDINSMPYPPLFHLLLAPFCGSVSSALAAATFMQLLFYPLGLLAIMFLVKKYCGFKVSILTGVLLLGSYYAFAQYQARPQSLEMLFYPVMLWAAMEKKQLTFIGSVLVMFYTHSPISIALTLGTFVWLLRKDLFDMKVWQSIGFSTFILGYQASWIFSEVTVTRWIASGDLGILPETLAFFSNPLFWLLNGLGISILGFPLVCIYLAKWKGLSEFQKLFLSSLLGMIIVVPVWYQRAMTFAVVPIAFFTAFWMAGQQRKHPRLFYGLLVALTVQVVLFSLLPSWSMSPAPYFDHYW